MKINLHWMNYRWAGIWVIVAVLAPFTEGGLSAVPGALILSGGLYYIGRLRLKNTHMTFDGSKVILTKGLFSKSVSELPLGDVSMIKTHQGKIGQMLGYGTFSVFSSAGAPLSIEPVADPEVSKQKATEYIQDIKGAQNDEGN